MHLLAGSEPEPLGDLRLGIAVCGGQRRVEPSGQDVAQPGARGAQFARREDDVARAGGAAALDVCGRGAAAGAAPGETAAASALTRWGRPPTAVGVLMTLTGGIVALPLIGIVLYQAAWLVITLFFPLMQR